MIKKITEDVYINLNEILCVENVQDFTVVTFKNDKQLRLFTKDIKENVLKNMMY